MAEKRIQKGLLFSLLLHATLVVFTIFAPSLHRTPKVELVEIDYSQPPLPLAPTSTQVKENLKQIVDQDKPVNNEVDEKSKFLSQHNQSIKKQTVAQKRGEFLNSKGTSAQPGEGGRPKLSLQQMLPKMDFAKAVHDKQAQEKEFDEAALKRALNKPVDQGQLDQRKPGGALSSQTLDYIKELDPGMETLLSTREFVYYSFYARIRTKLNQYWGPKVREKLNAMYKQGRQIASSDDRVSKLLITLDPRGQIVSIKIIGNSGYRELDEAAVEAFKSAAPFPNPPSGIVDQDGTIKIRWDFILEA